MPRLACLLAGVKVLAHDVRWEGGQCFWGKPLPVRHGAGVTGEFSAARLQEVLDFNANDPRKNWKAKKAAAADAGGGDGVTASGKARRGKASPGGKAAAAAPRKARAGGGRRRKAASESESEATAGGTSTGDSD